MIKVFQWMQKKSTSPTVLPISGFYNSDLEEKYLRKINQNLLRLTFQKVLKIKILRFQKEMLDVLILVPQSFLFSQENKLIFHSHNCE